MCTTQDRSREEWRDQRRTSAAVTPHEPWEQQNAERWAKVSWRVCTPQGFVFRGGGGCGAWSLVVAVNEKHGATHKHRKRTPRGRERMSHSSAGVSALHQKNRLSNRVE